MKQRLIDANALLAQLHVRYGFDSAADSVQELICAAPTIDAAPVAHARWIHPVPGDGEPYCSNCKGEQPFFMGYGYYCPDCCPHCGARMDAEEVRS